MKRVPRLIRLMHVWLTLSGLQQIGAQTPTQDPAQDPAKSDTQVSPQTAYERAVRPLEITRRSPQNWSDIELDALKVARDDARAECATRNPDQIAPSDLIGLARLCAFAQEWPAVHAAASRYIAGALHAANGNPAASAEGLSMAFDYQVQASLSLQDVDGALTACRSMLQAVPYDAYTSEASNSTLEAIRFTRINQALDLLQQRQQRIVDAMRLLHGAKGDATKAGGSADSALSVHALYADGLALPSLQQLANQGQAAARASTELESSLPAPIASEDAMYIDESKGQYRLLGQPIPSLHPDRWLLSPRAAPPQDINRRFANAVVLMLFPDWCSQCVTIGTGSKGKYDELAAADVRFFLLMAETSPSKSRLERSMDEEPRDAQDKSHRQHIEEKATIRATPEALLQGTPTLIVPSQTLTDFAATDYPWIVAADRNGVVRWIERAPDNALASDGDVNRIVNLILANWPPRGH